MRDNLLVFVRVFTAKTLHWNLCVTLQLGPLNTAIYGCYNV